MRLGIGLPAAVPGTPATDIADWAATSERQGFESLAVLDRLVYDNLDPLVALAAAAARTERVELLTTILGVPYRQSALALAKQLASIDQLSGGRLTAGLALGGWPEDYQASGTSLADRGAAFEDMLTTMRRAWSGDISGAAGPMPKLAPGRPSVLLGAVLPVGFRRAATYGEGWVAPFFGHQLLVDGIAAIRRAWADAGRHGRPRVVVARYFCLGSGADRVADDYLRHYYGDEHFATARADTLTSPERLHAEIGRLAEAGCDDLLLFPCAGDLEQVTMLAQALHQAPACA
jgi:alkanesulfonate monooxygenase SsuD/methylene tetrahydromethanopterin reductase-like flavin-dependent oxidoreductase (luciferase family)